MKIYSKKEKLVLKSFLRARIVYPFEYDLVKRGKEDGILNTSLLCFEEDSFFLSAVLTEQGRKKLFPKFSLLWFLNKIFRKKERDGMV